MCDVRVAENDADNMRGEAEISEHRGHRAAQIVTVPAQCPAGCLQLLGFPVDEETAAGGRKRAGGVRPASVLSA